MGNRKVLRGLDLGNEIWLLDQKDIAKEIVKQEADYVLALKENQKTLYDDVNSIFIRAEANKQKPYKKNVTPS